MPYVGTVVDGILNSGVVNTGDAVLLGPDANGNYFGSVIKSIQRKRFIIIYHIIKIKGLLIPFGLE